MHRHLAVAISVIGVVFGASAWLAADASAQFLAPERVVARAATAAGRVQGLVRDGAGQGVPGASVLAVGQTIISARSDVRGRFLLSLPPGDYVLRASRDGYVSNYREMVRVQSTTRLERDITLTRQVDPPKDLATDDGHAHTDMAWILRHLPRSVLRDGSDILPGRPEGANGRIDPLRGDLAGESASRVAQALAGSDLQGQVNFVTTAVAGPMSAWSQVPWPRGIAYVSLGAPVVGYGAWQVRAAMASGEGSSWNVLGEFASDPGRAHLWKAGLSFSAQGYALSTERLSEAVAETRSVAGISGQDRWLIGSRVEINYGARADRFDYLAKPQLFSANGGVSVRVLPRTFVAASAARGMIAPGVDEFLPPPDGGPWLPAERTFVPLSGRGTLRAEQLLNGEVVVTHRFGPGAESPTVQVRRFWQRSADQMATMFGVEGQTSHGQYVVAQVGSVDLAGWGVGVSGRFSRYLIGRVEYARVSSDWRASRWVQEISLAAPSVLRGDREQLHDLTASLDANLSKTSTHVGLVYRASTAFSPEDGARAPVPGSRFDLQVRQALPYRPTPSSRLELLFAVRNLFRDVRSQTSWYDELLTVGPPLRLMGGIQVRF